VNAVPQMSQAEQEQLSALILRIGIKGMLQRLDITEE
jgi:hypothetical protein